MPEITASTSGPAAGTSARGTLVLIHGAWAGHWVWDRLRPLMEAQGWRTLAPGLPGCGEQLGEPAEASLQACAEALARRLEQEPGPLLLAGHSGGGAVATQLAEMLAERVLGVVYIAGMMLPSGTGFADIVRQLLPEHPEVAGIGPHLQWNPERTVSRVPPEAAASIFFNDLPATEARRIASRLGPQAEGSRAMVPHWTPERFGTLPRLYIEATRDQSVTLQAQRTMQALTPGADVVSLNAGHAPQVSQPGAVAGAIGSFARRIPAPVLAPANSPQTTSSLTTSIR